MLTALYTIVVFCLIVAIHEFGHFAAAKLTGVTVHEFAIGMGPKLFSFSKNNTLYSLRLLPLGGYVKLEGEDEDSSDVNAFCNKKPWQRFIVLFAGAFMNFLLGFLLYIILFSCAGGITTNVIGEVSPGSPFSANGIKSGDVILSMESDGYKSDISDYNDISYFIARNSGKEVKFVFERNGREFVKTITPSEVEGYKGRIFGFKPYVEKTNVSNVIVASFRQCKFVVKVVFGSFVDLFTGRLSFSSMSGPVGIVNEIGTAAEEGLRVNFLQSLLNVMSLAALISINLGVMNLLPLPALDGGRIMFVLIEAVRRKPIDRNKEGIFHFIGFVLLIALMIIITFSDIKRIFL